MCWSILVQHLTERLFPSSKSVFVKWDHGWKWTVKRSTRVSPGNFRMTPLTPTSGSSLSLSRNGIMTVSRSIQVHIVERWSVCLCITTRLAQGQHWDHTGCTGEHNRYASDSTRIKRGPVKMASGGWKWRDHHRCLECGNLFTCKWLDLGI